MNPLALVAIAAILLLYSFAISRKLTSAISWPYLRKPWFLLSNLVLLLLALSAFYAYFLAHPSERFLAYKNSDLIVSAIILYSSILVFAAVRAGYSLVDGLKMTERDIISRKSVVESDKGALDAERKQLEAKKEELDKLLEELYTTRYKIETGRIGAGSRKLKKRLEELRKKE